MSVLKTLKIMRKLDGEIVSLNVDVGNGVSVRGQLRVYDDGSCFFSTPEESDTFPGGSVGVATFTVEHVKSVKIQRRWPSIVRL